MGTLLMSAPPSRLCCRSLAIGSGRLAVFGADLLIIYGLSAYGEQRSRAAA
jgi:hypothetical protein